MDHPDPPRQFIPKDILVYLRKLKAWNISTRLVSSSTVVVSDEAGGRMAHVDRTGGGGLGVTPLQPFELVKVSDGSGEDKVFRVIGSTVFGDEPTFSGATAAGADWLVTVTATGKLWAEINYADATDGSVSSVALATGASKPADDTGEKYVQIGRYEVDDDTLTVHNDRYGPIEGTICRNHFAGSAPYHAISVDPS